MWDKNSHMYAAPQHIYITEFDLFNEASVIFQTEKKSNLEAYL